MRMLALCLVVVLLASLGCGADNSAVAPKNPAPPPQNLSVQPMGSKAATADPPAPPR